MNFPAFLKGPAILTGALSTVILAATAGTKKNDDLSKIEVTVKLKSKSSTETTETWLISINNLSDLSKQKYKGSDGSGEYKTAEASKGKLFELIKKFLEIDYKLNRIKSFIWLKKQDEIKDCKTCCANSQAGCPAGQAGKCCCQEICSLGEMTKDTLNNFYLSIANLNTSFSSKYLNPIKAVVNIDTSGASEGASEGEDYSSGTLWGSVIYGFVNYKYKSSTPPTENQEFSKTIIESSSGTSTNKEFASVPKKFTLGKEDQDNTIGSIYKKLTDKLKRLEKIESLQKDQSQTNSNNCCWCICCDTAANTPTIDCLIKNSYAVSLTDGKTDDWINKVKDCCTNATKGS